MEDSLQRNLRAGLGFLVWEVGPVGTQPKKDPCSLWRFLEKREKKGKKRELFFLFFFKTFRNDLKQTFWFALFFEPKA